MMNLGGSRNRENPNNINRDYGWKLSEGQKLSEGWNPTIHFIRKNNNIANPT